MTGPGSSSIPARFCEESMLRPTYLALAKVSRIMTRIVEAIIALLIATCALDVVYQVAYRFIIVKFFTISSPFTEEYARYAMIWSAYLGIALCFREANMPSLNLLHDALKGIYKYVLYAVVRILILIFLVIGIRWGYSAMINMQNYRSPVMMLPGIMLYSAPFAACVMLAFEFVVDVIGVVSGELQPFQGRTPVDSSEIHMEAT